MAAPIAGLFLDIGGVLLTNGWGRGSRRKAAQVFGLEFDEMDERHHLTFGAYEEGKITLDEYLDRVVFESPRPFSREAFKEFMLGESRADHDMLALMEDIKRRHGVKIAVVSNEGRELTVHRVEKFGLKRFVDFFVVSCFIHIRKPDADVFRIALDIAQIPAGNILYVDDRSMFVEVAAGMGINGIHHTDYRTTREKLLEHGLG